MNWSNREVIAGGLFFLFLGVALIFENLGGPDLLNLGVPDLLIIGLVILLLWGARRLPDLVRPESFAKRDDLMFEERLSFVSMILLLFAAFMWTALLLKTYE
jgi:hypothetical protein